MVIEGGIKSVTIGGRTFPVSGEVPDRIAGGTTAAGRSWSITVPCNADPVELARFFAHVQWMRSHSPERRRPKRARKPGTKRWARYHERRIAMLERREDARVNARHDRIARERAAFFRDLPPGTSTKSALLGLLAPSVMRQLPPGAKVIKATVSGGKVELQVVLPQALNMVSVEVGFSHG